MTKRVLLIFAHPDDESFIIGGSIAKMAHEGAEIHLMTATKGEAGKTAGLCEQGSLGVLREKELEKASRILGIKELAFLGYLDKEVAAAPAARIIEQLVRKIREFRPHLVLTFGPDGASGHRDHRAIHYWTKAAVKLAGEAVEEEWGHPYRLPRLCYVVAAWRTDRQGRNHTDYTIDIKHWSGIKWRAIEQHKTQVFSINKFAAMSKKLKDVYLGQEFFNNDQEFSQYTGHGNDLLAGLEYCEKK